MKKEIDDSFDFGFDGRSVFQLFPSVFNDDRGWFAEMLRSEHNIIDIKQINRSCSMPGIIRGCHAQRGPFCQAKLVEAVNVDLFDVITDARPTSSTFGKSKMYMLNIEKQNKLYVPRGFLHAFIVPHVAQTMAYFNYYCDNVYDKASEICISSRDIIAPLLSELDSSCKLNNDFDSYNVSDKDKLGKPLNEFLASVRKEFKETGKFWYE